MSELKLKTLNKIWKENLLKSISNLSNPKQIKNGDESK